MRAVGIPTRHIALTGALAAAALIVGQPWTAPAHGAVRSCPIVVFQPGTGDGIFELRATNTTCRVASHVARGARPTSTIRGPWRYTRAGFTCRGRPQFVGAAWRCTRGQARITFVRG
jgi:hypothetical protein